MVGGSARVMATRIVVGPNDAWHSCVPVCRPVFVASSDVGADFIRWSERAGGLHFDCWRPGGGGGFW
jgi:hypothetical protein